jgi:hypothetical protein
MPLEQSCLRQDVTALTFKRTNDKAINFAMTKHKMTDIDNFWKMFFDKKMRFIFYFRYQI